MLDPTLSQRFQKLIDSQISERRQQFILELMQIDSSSVASGVFRSSGRSLQIQRAYEHELKIRSMIAWESLVRVHRTLGCPRSVELRDDLKTAIANRINSDLTELKQDFMTRASIPQAQASLTLAGVRQHLFEKHEVEIDLYVDALSFSNSNERSHPMTQQYHFYGTVGAFQTGPNSVANVVQHLSTEDRASLSAAVSLVREALRTAPSVEETQRRELIEMADECSSQIASESPNNTKLLTTFNVLSTAIQSIASAQPAYQALKLALVPLGISLP